MSRHVLVLYITGGTVRSQQAVDNLNRICQTELRGQYELQIIDILEHPELAERAGVLATPTLVKELPPPLMRLIGDLSNTEQVLFELGVVPCMLGKEDKPRPC